MIHPRPLIAVPARFAATTSALRHRAEVNARALIEAVWQAGGEPVSLHPHAPGGTVTPSEVTARLARFDGVLLPGGGDVSPDRYGDRASHPGLDDVNAEQDGFDLGVAGRALETGLPLLAVCRGLQIVNVARGGTLQQDMGADREHRHLVHPVSLEPESAVAAATRAEKIDASCFHHQRVARLGAGLTVTARAADGTIEALELQDSLGWFAAVQWHPEDTAPRDAANQGLFDALVHAARRRVRG